MKEKQVHILVFVAVLIIAIHQKFWTYDWTYIYFGAALAIGARVAKRYGVWFGLTAAYFLGRGLWGLTARAAYPLAGKWETMIMETLVGSGTLTWLVCLLGALSLGRYLKHVPEMIAGIFAANVLLVCFQGIVGSYPGGFLGNASMNACFLVATFPYFAGLLEDRTNNVWAPWAALGALGIVIFVTGSAVALGMLAIFVLTVLAAASPGLAVPAAVAVGVAYIYYRGTPFLADSGRFGIWDLALKFQKVTIGHQWFGTGPGTWGVYVPTMQRLLMEPGQQVSMFPWLHNDWLQMLLEYGRVGFILFAGSVLLLFKRAAETVQIPTLISMGLFCLYGLFNYPVHSPGAAMVISLMVAYTLEGPYAGSSTIKHKE